MHATTAAERSGVERRGRVPPARRRTSHGAFPRLERRRRSARLARRGRAAAHDAGEVLIAEGEPSDDFFVVLDGHGRRRRGLRRRPTSTCRVHGPGRFLGELGLLTASRPSSPRSSASRARSWPCRSSGCASCVARGPRPRRPGPAGLPHPPLAADRARAGFRIVGSRYSPDTRRLREFAARNRLPHRWIDLETDPEAEALLRAARARPEDTPVVIWRGTTVLRNPEQRRAGPAHRPAPRRRPREAVCDLVVVGAGPAGLAAAVYGASEGLGTVVLDAVATGGQAGTPRASRTTSASPRHLRRRAGRAGGDPGARSSARAISVPAEAVAPGAARRAPRRSARRRRRAGRTPHGGRSPPAPATAGSTVPRPRASSRARASTTPRPRSRPQLCARRPGGGGRRRQLGRPGRASSSPSTPPRCTSGPRATTSTRTCRATWSTGSSATRASRCCCTPRCASWSATAAARGRRRRGHADRRAAAPRRPRAVRLHRRRAAHRWLADLVALDDAASSSPGRRAAAVAPRRVRRTRPLLLETSLPGVFAAGDVRSGSVKRVASAVGEGAMAVRLVHEHLATAR